ncbi:MAG: aminoglycoside phosphotransferase family protein [Chloroflexota bacterium]
MKENGPISPELLDRIVRAAVSQSPQTITPITQQGNSNAVYAVTTSTDSLIVRLDVTGGALPVYQKEAACLSWVKEIGVPSANVLAVGEMDDVAYMVQTRVAGLIGTEWGGDKTAVWREIGRLAQQINTIPVHGYGDWLDDAATRRFHPSWESYVGWYLDFIFDGQLVDTAVLTTAQANKAQKLLAQLLDWRFEQRLCHGNLALKNVIVGDNGACTIIDWGNSAAQRAPHFEVAEVAAWDVDERGIRPFLAGYGLTQTQYAAMQPELELLQLWRWLDAIRWAMDRWEQWERVDFVQMAWRRAKRLLIG